jgi:MYXO-CTERM domain-containing protein
MKPNLMIAAAAAAFAIAGAGSAMAASYDLTKGTPVLAGGDDAAVYQATPVSPTEATFTYTYTFDLAAVGADNDVYTTINPIAVSPKSKYFGQDSVTNISASFYDLTTSTSAGTVAGGIGTIILPSDNDYSVTITGNNTTTVYGGAFGFDIQTSVAPVPGPTGFLVAAAGMGALFLMRRRIGGGLSA